MDKFDQVEFNSAVSIVLFGIYVISSFFYKCPSQLQLPYVKG